MNVTASSSNIADIIEPVARRLLGEPNRKLSKPGKGDLRYGSNGSLSVKANKGVFYDHENGDGGGVLDLVQRERGCDKAGAAEWLKHEGLLLDGQPTPSATPKPPEESQRLDRCFDYIDEDSVVLHQTVRFAPIKRFSQRRPDPDNPSNWKWDLNGIRTVLYRLPEVLEGIAKGQTIHLVEGEKDADNLAKLGPIATTNPMGAGKWKSEYSETLRDADVIIIPDNDEAGRNHANVVGAALSGIAKRVRVLDLAAVWPECPHKGDISDWIDSAGAADPYVALIAYFADLPDWTPPKAAEQETEPDAWPTLDQAAYHGLAGDIVRTLDPHTESDPVAILVQVLTTFGNVVGNAAYYLVESDRHRANLFTVMVGVSSKGRKGTSAGRIREVIESADPTWFADRAVSGLSSGEGIIHAVRDAVVKWNSKEKCEETIDQGVQDKRLMVTESEFAGALAVMERPGNTLSPVIRNAWDGQRLQTLNKNSPQKATGAHISIGAHITETELRDRLTRTELANGFANRFLYFCVKRSKLLPHGGSLPPSEMIRLSERVQEAVAFAKEVGRVRMTDNAALAWEQVYPELSADKPGLLGSVTARSEAQTIRVALIFALLDSKDEIGTNHLGAALSLVAYAEQSAARIFGDSLGNPVADEILMALRRNPDGMTRTDLQGLFHRHLPTDKLAVALTLLAKSGRARLETKNTGGRPVDVWFAMGSKP